MNIIDNAQKIISHISLQAGIAPFEFDDEGRAFFTADEMSFLFYAMEDENTLITAIYIGQPDLDDAEFLYTVLSGNHLWEFTGGGTLSLDKDTGHLCLCHRLNLPLEEIGDIESVFGSLLGAAQYWKNRLNSAPNDDGRPEQSDPHFLKV